jgi:hypothetical protein
MVTLPTGVYLLTILTLRWPSILDCHFSGQLRADYIRGQVLVQLESEH